jgi:hypothetical protein
MPNSSGGAEHSGRVTTGAKSNLIFEPSRVDRRLRRAFRGYRIQKSVPIMLACALERTCKRACSSALGMADTDRCMIQPRHLRRAVHFKRVLRCMFKRYMFIDAGVD